MSVEGIPCLLPILSEFFGSRARRTSLEFGAGGALLPSSLHIFQDAEHGALPPNMAIQHIMGDGPGRGAPGVGTILVMKTETVIHPFYVDFEDDDVAHVREFFRRL